MNRKYFEKKYKNPLPKLKEEERIYLKQENCIVE